MVLVRFSNCVLSVVQILLLSPDTVFLSFEKPGSIVQDGVFVSPL